MVKNASLSSTRRKLSHPALPLGPLEGEASRTLSSMNTLCGKDIGYRLSAISDYRFNVFLLT